MNKSKVAFIVSKFPCYDEAFILRELDAMSAKLDLVIFSLRKSKEKTVHDQAKKLLKNTIFIPYFFSWRILGAHAHFLVRHPFRYLKAFGRLVFGNLRSPAFLVKNLIFFPKAVYLARWIQKKKITHLHAYWATYPASVAMVASEISGVPFSFTGHAHDIYLDTTHLREKIRRSRWVSTCTESNKRYLEKISSPAASGKLFVNYHGLPLNHFSVNGKTRNRLFEILSVGTLQQHKGFNYLLEALALLKKKNLQFHCTIVGGGPLEYDLRKHIRWLHLEGEITMTGALKQSEIIPYYKKADLLVLMAQPEWHWGIPNVLIEALACKTPVVTTRFGSVEELIEEGKTGLFVDSKDSKALALAIEKLYQDDELRRTLASTGQKFVKENFDLEKNIEIFSRRMTAEATSLEVARC